MLVVVLQAVYRTLPSDGPTPAYALGQRQCTSWLLSGVGSRQAGLQRLGGPAGRVGRTEPGSARGCWSLWCPYVCAARGRTVAIAEAVFVGVLAWSTGLVSELVVARVVSAHAERLRYGLVVRRGRRVRPAAVAYSGQGVRGPVSSGPLGTGPGERGGAYQPGARRRCAGRSRTGQPPEVRTGG